MVLRNAVVFLLPVVAASHRHKTVLVTILKSKLNYFAQLNRDLHNVVNDLFKSLNLEATLLNNTRNKLLLTMHYDMKTIAENNYEVYEIMQHVAKLDNDNKTQVGLYELIGNILDKEEFKGSGVIKQKRRKHRKHKTAINYTTTPFFRDGSVFNRFVKDFVAKVDKLAVKDFQKEPQRYTASTKHRIATDKYDDDFTEDNIEIWKPPTANELDYINGTEHRRIYHGKKAKIKYFPFIASIHFLGSFVCAGSIISSDLILSAASCLQLLYNNRFYRENPKSLSVRIGSDYLVAGGEVIDIIETYFHPSYDPKTLKNNLVILRMEKHINFSMKRKKVRRILYDRTAEHLSENTDGVLILGWGAKESFTDEIFMPSHISFSQSLFLGLLKWFEEDQHLEHLNPAPYTVTLFQKTQILSHLQRLMVSHLDFYDNDNCAKIYSSTYVTHLHFCAGFISSPAGACNKDLGGPGIVSGKLIGVISFGSPVCGALDAPTVFTKLGYYASWIDSIMRMQRVITGAQTTSRPLKMIKERYFPTGLRHPITPVNDYALIENTTAEGTFSGMRMLPKSILEFFKVSSIRVTLQTPPQPKEKKVEEKLRDQPEEYPTQKLERQLELVEKDTKK